MIKALRFQIYCLSHSIRVRKIFIAHCKISTEVVRRKLEVAFAHHVGVDHRTLSDYDEVEGIKFIVLTSDVYGFLISKTFLACMRQSLDDGVL